uniref:CCHC-type domain-containing protein n=1 Tax=Phytophthora ramorum TaxID=164328 RepID=H3H504_PHYRM
MVRVPGSSGDSQGFHRESTEEDVKIKTEPGNESSTEDESPPTALKAPGSSDRESAGRSSDDVMEEGSAMDLEEKPHPPPQVPSGTPADHDANRDPPDEGSTVKTEGPSSKTTPPASLATSKKKSKTSRKKLKAPESKAEDQEDRNTWTDEQLESAFFYKDLYKFLHEDPVMKIVRPKPIGELQGPVKAPKEVTSQLEAVKLLMRMLKEAGIVLGSFDANELFDVEVPVIRESTLNLFAKLTPLVGSVVPVQRARPTPTRSQTGSSQYASATSEAGSDSSIELQRMTLGPAGATMLQSRKERSEAKPTVIASSDPVRAPPERMQSFFNAAMERFLKEEQATVTPPAAVRNSPTGAQDVDMESVGSNRLDHSHPSEYDPDDLNVVASRAAVASAGATGGGTLSATRIRRSDESPLEYLHRLNVAGLRAQLLIKDGSIEVRREHVDHFIETLDDRDLASQLALLRIPDADTLEETLRSRQRAKARQGKTVYGSIKPKQKPPTGITPSANTRAVRTVRATANSSESELETSGSEGEGDLRKVYFAATPDQPTRSRSDQDQRRPSRDSNDRRLDRPAGPPEGEVPRKPCSHYGSSKHTDLGCWKRLTCEKCGKKGHPTDRCLFVCKACGEIHGAGECPMEEFYNLIRQWYNPNKHGGMLPQAAEKMLN